MDNTIEEIERQRIADLIKAAIVEKPERLAKYLTDCIFWTKQTLKICKDLDFLEGIDNADWENLDTQVEADWDALYEHIDPEKIQEMEVWVHTVEVATEEPLNTFFTEVEIQILDHLI